MAYHRIRPDGKPRIPRNNFASMNLNNNIAILAQSDFECSDVPPAGPSTEETKRKNKNVSASSWINQFMGSSNDAES
uniref:Uncharacterized protein n=1 Tax=Romanomermis culicivorax TaxID=13658 RepID=A0A915J960_ROMCU